MEGLMSDFLLHSAQQLHPNDYISNKLIPQFYNIDYIVKLLLQ